MSLSSLALAYEQNEFNSLSFVLDKIEPAFDPELIISKLRPCSGRVERYLQTLISEASTAARPKAAIRVCRVEPLNEKEIFLENTLFSSELLNANLAGRLQAFAYVATEGIELADWADSLSSSAKAFSWYIRYAALKLAEKRALSFVKSTFSLSQVSSMNPGALKFWPLGDQVPMFQLLSPLPDTIGVRLRENLWMAPDLASTGVFFESRVKFYNCQLCKINPCEHRKVDYQGYSGWPQTGIRLQMEAVI